MQRIKINFPTTIHYTCTVPVLIQHINYGNHVGNDSIVSIIHDARVQFLQSLQYTELNIEDTGIIMSGLSISFKKQIFYGDTLLIQVTCADFSETAFSIYYNILISNKSNVIACTAVTNMVCFDYAVQKITTIPKAFLLKLTQS